MTVELVAVTVAVGLLAGRLAGFVMQRRGYGLIGDVLLGLGGSLVGGWFFPAVGLGLGGEWMAMVAAAFAGATFLIMAQRMLWPLGGQA